MSFRPKIGWLLFFTGLVAAGLVLAGIALLKIYSSELVRRTEMSLLAQGVVLSHQASSMFFHRLGSRAAHYGNPVAGDMAARANGAAWDSAIAPSLVLHGATIHLPTPPARPARFVADPVAREVGEAMAPLLKAAQKISLAGIRLVDYRGVVIASTGAHLGQRLGHWPGVKLALVGRGGSRLVRREPEPARPGGASRTRTVKYRVHVALPLLHAGRVAGAVLMMRTPPGMLEALRIHGRLLVWGGVGLLGLVALVGFFVSRTITRPLSRLTKSLERVTSGKAKTMEPIDKPVTQEVAQLGEAFSRMTKALERRTERVGILAGDISHALKNPISGIKAALEVLEDGHAEMSPEQRELFLAGMARDADRLEKLVKRLVELAKAEVMRPTDTRCDLARELPRILVPHGDRGAKVELALAERELQVGMDCQVVEAIVSNLINNSLKHGGPGVAIKVSAAKPAGDPEEWVELTVADDGPGVSPGNAGKIFDTFFTTAKDKGGTGLGLAIVSALLRVHGGSVELASSQKGAAFLVKLPTKPHAVI